MSATTVRPSAAPRDLTVGAPVARDETAWRPSSGGVAARAGVLALVLGAIGVLPLLVAPLTRNVLATTAVYGMVALSLNVLVGYTGQVSLGHSAFLGVGAFGVGFVLTQLALPWPVGVAVAVALGMGIAALLGVVALRVRGLYLALVTLALAVFAERVLFGIEPLTGGGAGQTAARPAWAAADLTYAYVCFGGLALAWLLDWRLTASKAGRAIRALRDSERVAASWGIDVTRYKLLAFVTSGAIAGLAGALFASITEIVSPITFNFMLSLSFLMMVVVGGIGSRIGVVLGATLYTALPYLLDAADGRFRWFPVDGSASQVIGALLLLLVLVRFPGGLAQLLSPLIRWCSFKPAGAPRTGPTPTARGCNDVRPWLSARGISIRFGGLQALDDVGLDVNEQEIVGLIGPNGAGKTTFFNCLTGFYAPTSGDVFVRGERVTDLRPDERTVRGVGRTFQHVGLVRSFTVLENLLVAQHRNVGYGVASGLLGLPHARREERVLRRRPRTLLGELGLRHLADESLHGLSYGMLKQVEVAAVLATDPDVLMLDEPLAGLGPEEADAFAGRLLDMRRELGLTIVVIEHHVPFMLRICDYLYVLNFGRPLAEGRPDEIRGNTDVAEAYLGKGAVALA